MGGVATKNEQFRFLPMQNLLTNSGFGVWSNSGLTQGVGSGRQTDYNVSNILTDADGSTAASWTGSNCTITDAGANLLLTATATAAATAIYTLTIPAAGVGKLFKASIVTANGTHSWDNTSDTLTATNNAGAAIAGASVALNAGTNSIIWEATETNNKIKVTIGAFTDTETLNITSIYVDEVTDGCVAADALGPDGWSKSSVTDVYREHNGSNTKDGSFYALKMVGGADYHNIDWPITDASLDEVSTLPHFYKKFAGRTVTLGAWVLCSSANKAKIIIYDSTGSTSSAFHSGGGTYEWLEVTRTIASATTYFFISLDPGASTTAYFSQPMLVYGNSIGAGNYSPMPGERILCESNITLTGYTATTSAADAIINLEAASSGKIGKGAKAVLVKAYGKDSAAGDGVGFDVQSASGVEDGISIDTQVNNIRVQGQGWVKCDSNGDIYFDHRGSGASALTVDIKVIGVEV